MNIGNVYHSSDATSGNNTINAKGSESLPTHYFFTQKQQEKAERGHFIKSVLCGVG